MFETRPGKPPDAPAIVPYLTVPDVGEALAFYEAAFGFTQRMAAKGPGGVIDHAEMTVGQGGRIMLGPESNMHTARATMTSGTPAPIALYVYTDSVSRLFDHATANGAFEIDPPQVMFWGDRVAILADPWGYKWTFAQSVADYDPSVIPS